MLRLPGLSDLETVLLLAVSKKPREESTETNLENGITRSKIELILTLFSAENKETKDSKIPFSSIVAVSGVSKDRSRLEVPGPRDPLSRAFARLFIFIIRAVQLRMRFKRDGEAGNRY
jgi:hypothetical protein